MVWEAPSSILNSDSSCRIFSSQVNSAVEYVKHFELSPPHNWRPSRPPSPKSVERDRLRERERQARAQMSLQAEREAEVVGGPFFGAPVKLKTARQDTCRLARAVESLELNIDPPVCHGPSSRRPPFAVDEMSSFTHGLFYITNIRYFALITRVNYTGSGQDHDRWVVVSLSHTRV
uniref:Uncharacterized protein n=1 Tax=Timema douglasi TaxID=61478 RepID=A0A7R8VCW5_TIMDO|nr:unnamed protein product [Timema douglasi]